jgi:predicted permease
MKLLSRVLLRLYPRRFREEFGEELMQVFRTAWRNAGLAQRGHLLLDLCLGSLRERFTLSPQPAPLTRDPSAMPGFFVELRQAIRALARAPGFTLAVLATLALGIGANTAIFSVVDGVLLRPAPFPDMQRLTMLWETDRKSGTVREPASIPDYFDFKSRTTRYTGLAAFSPIPASITPARGEPRRVAGLWITHDFLPLVGLTAQLGRAIGPDDDRSNAPPVALISDALWSQLFDRQRAALGSTLRINDRPTTIIGILPPAADFGTLQILSAADYRKGFAESGGQVRVDVWLPMRADPARAPRGNHPIFMMGRLKPDATLAQAQREMTSVASDLEQSYRQDNDGRGVHVEALSEVVFGGVREALFVLLGAVTLVLLVACANVANLLLARGAARGREVTVRAALGATPARLTRQFLVEGLLLTVIGALAGVGLAVLGLRTLLALAPASLPRVSAVAIDLRVLGATLAVVVLVGVSFGLIPAVQARRRGIHGALQAEAGRAASAGREHRRLRSTLVVAELSFAVLLLVGAGLLIKSLWRLSRVDPGFEAAGVLKAEFQLSAKYPQRDWPRWQETRQFSEAVRQRVAALPGVVSVAIASNHPLEAGYTSSIVVVGREAEAEDYPEPSLRQVDPSYFSTLHVALLEGRLFSGGDDLAAPAVLIINEAARRRFFAGGHPVGQQIQLWGMARTVVGVVADEHIHGLATAAPPALYLPTGQAPTGNGSILVRTSGDPRALAAALRGAVRSVDPEIPLFGVEPLTETLSGTLDQRRFTMLVLGSFAGAALLLAMVGVHGVLSYTVAQRNREIGIRMALGADRTSVGRLVVGQGARLAGAGLAIGALGAIVLSRVLTGLLFGVKPLDPLTFIAVGIGLGTVALLATWAPAHKASRVDPMVVLRAE